MVDISENPGSQRIVRFREGEQRSERALAIKQGWLQAFDVLDIGLSHASLSHDPDQQHAQQLVSVNPASDKLTKTNEVGASIEPAYGSIDITKDYYNNQSLHKDLASMAMMPDNGQLKKPIAITQQNFSFSNGVKPVSEAVVTGDGQSGFIEVLQAKKVQQFAMTNYINRYSTGATASETGSENPSSLPALINRKDSEVAQPSQVSLAKLDNGYMILARDYRTSEKVFTKKLVDSLKSLLLANGVLKKILMNGKTIF
jgi:hypothetical protein